MEVGQGNQAGEKESQDQAKESESHLQAQSHKTTNLSATTQAKRTDCRPM